MVNYAFVMAFVPLIAAGLLWGGVGAPAYQQDQFQHRHGLLHTTGTVDYSTCDTNSCSYKSYFGSYAVNGVPHHGVRIAYYTDRALTSPVELLVDPAHPNKAEVVGISHNVLLVGLRLLFVSCFAAAMGLLWWWTRVRRFHADKAAGRVPKRKAAARAQRALVPGGATLSPQPRLGRVLMRINWAAAPRDVWRVVALVAAATVASFVVGAFVVALHHGAWWAARIAFGLAIAAVLLWVALKVLTRRRWAWVLEWILVFGTIVASVIDIARGAYLVDPVFSLAWSIPALNLLSRASVRTWMLPVPRWPRQLPQPRPARSAARLAAPVPVISTPEPDPPVEPLHDAAPLRVRRPSTPSGRLPGASALALLIQGGATSASLAERYGVTEQDVWEKMRAT